MNSKLFNASVMSLMLTTTSGQALSQDHPLGHDHYDDHSANTSQQDEFSQPIQQGRQTKYLGVDCDLLKDGQITPEFIRNFGVSSHMDREDRLLGQNVTDKEKQNKYVLHLSAHYGLVNTKEAIIDSALKCRENFPEKSGLEL